MEVSHFICLEVGEFFRLPGGKLGYAVCCDHPHPATWEVLKQGEHKLAKCLKCGQASFLDGWTATYVQIVDSSGQPTKQRQVDWSLGLKRVP